MRDADQRPPHLVALKHDFLAQLAPSRPLWTALKEPTPPG
jgi:hypothetical protein